MSVFQVVIFFIFGFILGGLFVWFLRKSEINTIKKNNDELKSAFGNLSKEALDQNLSTFLKIAEDKFKDLVQKSDGSLEQKKELIDLSLNEMNKKLEGCMLFFPSALNHMVYPFYNCSEDRVSVSGNIFF